ncbi:MAG: hypothetical protein IPM84_19670 [Anaerolineae bacterium]|nr:hypothetical protein [Anaerolineae bacterium]
MIGQPGIPGQDEGQVAGPIFCTYQELALPRQVFSQGAAGLAFSYSLFRQRDPLILKGNPPLPQGQPA